MIFTSRQVEFIFAQFSPAVCLPCKQTDFTKRIIALFRVLLYRLSSKKLLKIANTSSNQFELEFTFSFDLNSEKIRMVLMGIHQHRKNYTIRILI